MKPLKLQLGAAEWLLQADLTAATSTGEDVGDMGETRPYHQTMTIYWPEHERQGCHPESTVLHELMHAVLADAGLSDQLQAVDKTGGLEEALVVALENGLGPHVELAPNIRRWVARVEAAWTRRSRSRRSPDQDDES